jgi:hypothetical protein
MNLRPLALLATSFLCAACIGLTGDPTALPSAAKPSPSPKRSLPDLATFTPFPVATPTPACPDIPAEAGLVLRFDGIERSMSLAVIEARTPTGGLASFAPGHAPDDDLGNLPGGIPITLSLRSPEGSEVDANVSVTASLIVAAATQQLTIGRTGEAQTFVLPDVDSTARLDVTVTFEDSCRAYRAAGSATAMIGSRHTVAACPSESADRDAYLQTIAHGQQLTVDGHAVLTAIESGDWVWLGGSFASDAGTLFPMWDHDAPALVGSPGTEPIVRVTGDGRLTFVVTRFYRKDDAAHEMDRDIALVAETSRDMRPDGTTRMPLPPVDGEYVTFMQLRWQTPCLSATSIANFEVDVN